MPTDHVVATLRQTLLHKLAVQAAATHRLRCRCGRSTTRTNGGCTCCNIFQIRFVTAQQRSHHTCSANTRSSCRRRSACIHFIDGTHI